MIRIVCWYWRGEDPRRQYEASHVNRFARNVARHTTVPHEVVCVTDQREGIDASVRCLPMPEAVRGWPNHWRKLWLWSTEAGELIGERMFLSDLDVAIVECLDPLLERREDVVLWHDEDYPRIRYSTGNYLLTAGARPSVWEDFDLETSPAVLEAYYRHCGRRMVGSDMAWMSWRLHREATYGRADGIRRARYLGRSLPHGTRIVHFSGADKPWSPKAQRKYPWLMSIDA